MAAIRSVFASLRGWWCRFWLVLESPEELSAEVRAKCWSAIAMATGRSPAYKLLWPMCCSFSFLPTRINPFRISLNNNKIRFISSTGRFPLRIALVYGTRLATPDVYYFLRTLIISPRSFLSLFILTKGERGKVAEIVLEEGQMIGKLDGVANISFT